MSMKNPKAQSAMEYLMTYGWAILIIAVVLGALFSLGVFSSSSFLGTSCVPTSAFICSNPLLHNGNFMVTVGQSTGVQWTTANVFMESQGNGAPGSLPAGCHDSIPNGLFSGETNTITVSSYYNVGTQACDSFPSIGGSPVSGSLWVAYTISGNANTLYAQMGTITLKAS